MNFFIDFDHTLYNVGNLSKDMLDALAQYISKKTEKKQEEILERLKEKFNRNGIYDI